MGRNKYFEREEKWILSKEDWYPTLDGKIKVGLIHRLDADDLGYTWRVCVWGGDDFGLERDFNQDGGAGAKALYDRIVDWTTQDEMRILGLDNA